MANPFARRKKAKPANTAAQDLHQEPQETKEKSGFVQALYRIKESGLDPEKLFAKRRPPPCPRSVVSNMAIVANTAQDVTEDADQFFTIARFSHRLPVLQ